MYYVQDTPRTKILLYDLNYNLFLQIISFLPAASSTQRLNIATVNALFLFHFCSPHLCSFTQDQIEQAPPSISIAFRQTRKARYKYYCNFQ